MIIMINTCTMDLYYFISTCKPKNSPISSSIKISMSSSISRKNKPLSCRLPWREYKGWSSKGEEMKWQDVPPVLSRMSQDRPSAPTSTHTERNSMFFRELFQITQVIIQRVGMSETQSNHPMLHSVKKAPEYLSSWPKCQRKRVNI